MCAEGILPEMALLVSEIQSCVEEAELLASEHTVYKEINSSGLFCLYNFSEWGQFDIMKGGWYWIVIKISTFNIGFLE